MARHGAGMGAVRRSVLSSNQLLWAQTTTHTNSFGPVRPVSGCLVGQAGSVIMVRQRLASSGSVQEIFSQHILDPSIFKAFE